MNYFNITGMTRSGTTLLQNILNYLDNVYAGKQPFPKLFINAKKSFYESIVPPEKRFIYNNYCNEKLYQFEGFVQFLSTEKFSNEFVNAAIKKGYSEQGEDVSETNVIGIDDCFFDEMYKNLLSAVTQGRSSIKYNY